MRCLISWSCLRALKICFGGAALQRWTIADAFELKIELNAIAAEGNHTTMYGFLAHGVPYPPQFILEACEIL